MYIIEIFASFFSVLRVSFNILRNCSYHGRYSDSPGVEVGIKHIHVTRPFCSSKSLTKASGKRIQIRVPKKLINQTDFRNRLFNIADRISSTTCELSHTSK